MTLRTGTRETPRQLQAWLRTIEPAWGHWLAGLFDGEGCLSFVTHYKRGTLRPVMQVSLAQRADDALIRQLPGRFGIGSYQNFVTKTPCPLTGKQKQPMSAWIACSVRDLQRAAVLFTEFPLRSKKAREFLVWKEMVYRYASRQRTIRELGPLALELTKDRRKMDSVNCRARIIEFLELAELPIAA